MLFDGRAESICTVETFLDDFWSDDFLVGLGLLDGFAPPDADAPVEGGTAGFAVFSNDLLCEFSEFVFFSTSSPRLDGPPLNPLPPRPRPYPPLGATLPPGRPLPIPLKAEPGSPSRPHPVRGVEGWLAHIDWLVPPPIGEDEDM